MKINTVRELLEQPSVGVVIDIFDNTIDESASTELAMVRGWLMDELERRDKEAFDAWVDSGEDSPRRFFMAAQ